MVSARLTALLNEDDVSKMRTGGAVAEATRVKPHLQPDRSVTAISGEMSCLSWQKDNHRPIRLNRVAPIEAENVPVGIRQEIVGVGRQLKNAAVVSDRVSKERDDGIAVQGGAGCG